MGYVSSYESHFARLEQAASPSRPLAPLPFSMVLNTILHSEWANSAFTALNSSGGGRRRAARAVPLCCCTFSLSSTL